MASPSDLEQRVAQARASVGTLQPEALQSNILLIRQYLPLLWTDDTDDGKRNILRQLSGLNFTHAPTEYHWVRAGTLGHLEYSELFAAIDKANPEAIFIRRINGLGTTEYSVSLGGDQKAVFDKVPDSLTRLLTGAIGEPLKRKGIMMGDTTLLMVREAIQSQTQIKLAPGALPASATPQYFNQRLL